MLSMLRCLLLITKALWGFTITFNFFGICSLNFIQTFDMHFFVVLKSEIIRTFYIKFYSQMHRFHVLNYSRIELLFLRRRFLELGSVRESNASLTPSDSVSARLNLWDFIDWLVTAACQMNTISLILMQVQYFMTINRANN